MTRSNRISAFNRVRTLLEETRRRVLSSFVHPHPAPIFVLGNQKSGTTAIAALLAETTALSATLDLQWENQHWDYDRLVSGGTLFKDFLDRNRHEFSKALIKEPNLTIFFSELAETFSSAKFIFIARDPRDNLRSILNRMGIPGNLKQLDASHVTGLPLGWQRILEPGWLGLTGDRYIEVLASRWNFISDTYLRQPEKFILLRYEDFVADKLGVIQKLSIQLGLEPLRPIHHLLDVQFQSRGDRDVPLPVFFGEENLNSIEKICGERMKKLGYNPAPLMAKPAAADL